MGGYGSGRHGARPTIESTASYILDIKTLAPAFRRGSCLQGSIRFGDGAFVVDVTVDLRNEWNCVIELTHRSRNVWDGEQRTIIGKIQLTRTQPTFGGHRWWFLCPKTGQRTTKLFLPRGGRHFWSRRAYGLGYRSQREDRFSRLQRRAAALNRELGGEGWSTWDFPPTKPKGMRWRTYVRKLRQCQHVVDQANGEFAKRAYVLLDRPRYRAG
jgi:hypothetical protein